MLSHSCESCPYFRVDPLERDGMVAKRFDLRVQLERAAVINAAQHMIDHLNARVAHCDAIIDGIDQYLSTLPSSEQQAITNALDAMQDVRRRATTPRRIDLRGASANGRRAMRSEAAIRALNEYNQRRSATKKGAVRAAVVRLTGTSGEAVTQAEVARLAGVSREFINSHPELKALIKAANRRGEDNTAPTASRSDVVGHGLMAQNRTFAATVAHQKQTIAELRATIEQLRHQRKLHLGAQLVATTVDADTHLRLQLDHDRQVAENQRHLSRIEEMQHLIDRLKDDLNASRHAHAEDLARLTTPVSQWNAPVISLLDPRAPTQTTTSPFDAG